MTKSDDFKQGEHWRKIKPLAPRGAFTWNETRVILKMVAF